LRNGLAATELNGVCTFRYQAPDEACTETLNLGIAVEDS
jgi:hypothetical protein